MSTLTKAEIIETILSETGLEFEKVSKIVEESFEEIRCSLESGENVRISGFGNFLLRDKVARPGRNPNTGEAKEISARRVVSFKVGQKLKTAVSNSKAARKAVK